MKRSIYELFFDDRKDLSGFMLIHCLPTISCMASSTFFLVMTEIGLDQSWTVCFIRDKNTL